MLAHNRTELLSTIDKDPHFCRVRPWELLTGTNVDELCQGIEVHGIRSKYGPSVIGVFQLQPWKGVVAGQFMFWDVSLSKALNVIAAFT